MITQRSATTPVEAQGVLWDPQEEGVEPEPTDVYLVVDEQAEGGLVVVAARWPQVDSLGRLSFGDDDVVERAVPQAALQHVLAVRHPTVRRAIRIGDVFLVRGLQARTPRELRREIKTRDVSEWGTFVDVTGAAREAAKAALLAAAAPKLTPLRAQALEQSTPEGRRGPEEPPPQAPVAEPVV